MDDLYDGFGDRYDYDDDEDDDDEDEDVIDDDDDDGDEDVIDDDDDDDDDDDSSPRGCSRRGKKKDPMEMMSKLGRYFNASDYDEDYEE